MATRAILEAGFDENRFESPVSENFKCSICLNVLNDPKSCRNNQHYFCFGCIGQHLANFHTCPECMEELTPETLGTPPRVLMNCIAELPIKCNHSERGCSDLVQLGRLQNHLDQCGFAPVTCGNDGCEMEINKRDRIHHETELCEFRRVQCHNCGEIGEEMVKLGEKQDQLNKSQAKLEVKIDHVSIRLQNIEKNVITKINQLYLSNQRENAVAVNEIGEVKSFMNDVLLKLNSISTVVCEMQAAKKEESRQNQRENLQDSASQASLSIEKVECRSLSNPAQSEPQIKDNGMYAEAICPEFQTSSPIDKPRSRGSIRQRRCTTADDVTSQISDHDYRYLLPPRSHSSDSIKNEFPDATRSSYSRSATSTQTRGLGSPFAPDTPQQIDIGMTVLVSRHRGKLCKGIVQYVGYLPDKGDNVYVGLELHDTDGKHDGTSNGQRYFECKPNHGVFVLFEKIVMAYP